MVTLLPARAALAILLVASVSACGKVKASVPQPMPALEMPAPPGRLIIPATIPEPSPEPVAPAAVQTPVRQNNPQATRAAERSTPPPPEPTPPAPTPPAQPPVLLTTPNAGDLEQKAQGNIFAAQRDLQ